MASLAVACVLGVPVLGLVIAVVLREDTGDTDTDLASLFTPGKTEDLLQLAGVTLGMTPAGHQRMRPAQDAGHRRMPFPLVAFGRRVAERGHRPGQDLRRQAAHHADDGPGGHLP